MINQVFAVSEIYEELSKIVTETANCLQTKPSITVFSHSSEVLQFEVCRDNLFQRISTKYGSNKKVFTSRAHRAYVWETQFRQTGQFKRDRRGIAKV